LLKCSFSKIWDLGALDSEVFKSLCTYRDNDCFTGVVSPQREISSFWLKIYSVQSSSTIKFNAKFLLSEDNFVSEL
jgi:hypothetical protein